MFFGYEFMFSSLNVIENRGLSLESRVYLLITSRDKAFSFLDLVGFYILTQKTKTEKSRNLVFVIVIDDLRIGNRSGVLHDGPSNGIDPIFFLLLRISDEVHSLISRR